MMNLGNIGALAQTASEGVDKLVQEDWMQKEYRMKQQEAMQMAKIRQAQLQQLYQNIGQQGELFPLQKEKTELELDKVKTELAKDNIKNAVFGFLSTGNVNNLNLALKNDLTRDFITQNFGGIVRFDNITQDDLDKLVKINPKIKDIDIDKLKNRFVKVIDDEGQVHFLDMLQLGVMTGATTMLQKHQLENLKIAKTQQEIEQTQMETLKTAKELQYIDKEKIAKLDQIKKNIEYIDTLIQATKTGKNKTYSWEERQQASEMLVNNIETLENKMFELEDKGEVNTKKYKKVKQMLDHARQQFVILNPNAIVKDSKLQETLSLKYLLRDAANISGDEVNIGKHQATRIASILTPEIQEELAKKNIDLAAYGMIASLIRHSLYAGNLTEGEIKRWNQVFGQVGVDGINKILAGLLTMLKMKKGQIEAVLTTNPLAKTGTGLRIAKRDFDKVIKIIEQRLLPSLKVKKPSNPAELKKNLQLIFGNVKSKNKKERKINNEKTGELYRNDNQNKSTDFKSKYGIYFE